MGALIAEIVTARFLLATACFATILFLSLAFVNDQLVFKLAVVYGLSLFTLPLNLSWVFQGHDRMSLVALTQIIRQCVFAIVIVVFLRTSEDLVYVGFAELAAGCSAVIVSVGLFKRFFAADGFLRPELSLRLFREGVPIGISQMLWVVRMFGAVFIIGLVATAEDTGYFAGAMRIYIAVHAFVWLYYVNLLPSMSREWASGGSGLNSLLHHSICIVTVISLVGGVVWFTAAPFVMTLAYGPDFLPGGGALQWFGGACIAAALSGNYRYGLIAAGFQKEEMGVAAMGSILAIALIPFGYYQFGTDGAAAALFFAEIAVLLAAWRIARARFLGNLDKRNGASESSLKIISEGAQ